METVRSGLEAGGRKFCLIELSFGVRYTWRCMLFSLLYTRFLSLPNRIGWLAEPLGYVFCISGIRYGCDEPRRYTAVPAVDGFGVVLWVEDTSTARAAAAGGSEHTRHTWRDSSRLRTPRGVDGDEAAWESVALAGVYDS